MIRRSLAAALWLIAGLLASFLGSFSAFVGTAAGRDLLAHAASKALKGAVEGTIEIAEISGPLLTGVTLHDVKVFDADTTLVGAFKKVDATYNPFDFLAGRVVLLDMSLDRPVFNIVQHQNGRLNVEDLLRLGRPSTGPQGPATLILFRNVRIDDGTVNLRLQQHGPWQPGDEIDPLETEGVHRVHRFDHVSAIIPLLRISSPQEPGIHVEIDRLAVVSSDPEVELRDVSGGLTVIGDSLRVDLRRLALPHSALAGHGAVRWPHDTLLYNLAVRADSATLGDVPFLGLRFPPATVLRGNIRLRSHGGRLLEARMYPLDVRYGGGAATGRLTAITAADSGLVAIRDGELTAADFDLDFARQIVPALPFYGRVDGKASVDGTMKQLATDLDILFRDSLVSGARSRILGRGEIDLLDPEGMGFRPFTLDSLETSLATVHRLLPSMTLRGHVAARGTLTGTLHNTRFSGTLTHRDGDRKASTVSGDMGLDTRGDTASVYADVHTDSLSFETLRASFPGLPLRGDVAGAIKLSGTLGELDTHLDLESRRGGGAVRLDGLLTLLDNRTAARDLSVETRRLNLARWIGRAPESRLSVAVSGQFAQNDTEPPLGVIKAVLSPSMVAGTELDSGAVAFRMSDGRIYLDSLRLAEQDIQASGSGTLGWRRPETGTLALTIDADSLNALDSLLTTLAGRDTGTAKQSRALRGTAHLQVALEGALDSLALAGRAAVQGLHWRDWDVTSGRLHGRFEPGPNPVVEVGTLLDSLQYGKRAFGAAAATVIGTADSLHWFARSRLGDVSEFLAGGRFSRGAPLPGDPPASDVMLDSLAVLLPGGVWVLRQPVEARISDSTVTLGAVTLKSISDSGQIDLSADLPTVGEARAHVDVKQFPLAGVYALAGRDTAGVSGSINATVGLTGTRTSPIYQGSLALSKATVGEFGIPYLDGTFGYRDDHLDAALHLWRSGAEILRINARLPLDLSLRSVENRELPDSLSVRTRADSVDLAALGALTTVVSGLQGVFSADLGLAGTWQNPSLEGQLVIAGGAANIPALNVRYQGVAGQFALTGDTIKVRSLEAHSEKGRMDVAGYVRLEELTHPILALRITGDQFRALDLKGNLTVTASGKLALNGPVFGATLTGDATVTSGVLYFADLIEKRIIDLREFGDTTITSIIEQQGLGPEFQNVFLDELQIPTLNLNMGSDVWLRSSEANIQLTGSVKLSKQGKNYLLLGTLQAPRGTYRLKVGPVTKEFVVRQGTVKYYGTPDLDAQLDIQATHVVHPVPTPAQRSPEDINVVAHITGTLLVPRVSLEAENQNMAETEVISYLLFGRSSLDLGGGQGGLTNYQAVVQTAASTLSGELERSLISDLGVPLDYVEISPGSATDLLSGVQLAVGRQVGDKTFVVATAGFCQGRPVALNNTLGFSLQYRISPEFRTQASFEPVRTCSADPLIDPQATTVPHQVGFDLIWERRY
ncbi:MAG TPA: translocation/assembly module TamB domain-containing protein [Gemmatimonadales bacterium]|nr:translocation/assembly module TamB domain-containing protein [Gemmatimonadales bacterium]